MNWNVGQAKQHLSEVIREAAHEPQVIYNRNHPVAAVIAAEELAEYQAWKNAKRPSLVEVFDAMRSLANGDPDPLPEPNRYGEGRPNAFLEVLAEEELNEVSH